MTPEVQTVQKIETTTERATLPIGKLKAHPLNEVLYGKIQPDEELVASIRERGVLHPILVTPYLNTHTNHLSRADHEKFKDNPMVGYMIISGERRVVAAAAAGHSEIPADIRYYGEGGNCIGEIDVAITIDLIHANKARTKTEHQKNSEVKMLKQSFSYEAIKRQKDALKKGTQAGKGASGAIAPNRTAEQIAAKMGVSKDEVKRRTAVHDDEYQQERIDDLRELGASDETINDLLKEWSDIRSRQDGDGIALSDAAKRVAALMDKARKLCPYYKAPKKARPAKGVKIATKPVAKYNWRQYQPDDVMEVFGHAYCLGTRLELAQLDEGAGETLVLLCAGHCITIDPEDLP